MKISQNFVTFTEYMNFNKTNALKGLGIEYRVGSRESREIIGETETRKIDPRRDQSRGLESRLQALGSSPHEF